MTTASIERAAARGMSPAAKRSYLAVTYTLFIILAGNNLLSGLWPVYHQAFGFSPFTTTAIFATYAFTIIPSLLIFGSLADAYGRKRVMLAALCVALLATIVLLLAQGTPWLFAARFIQGLGMGAVSGAAAVALMELSGDKERAALVTGVAVIAGVGAGPLLGGIVAQYLPHARLSPYLIYLVLLAPAFPGIATMIEPLAKADRTVWRPHRPALPPDHRERFFLITVLGALAIAPGAIVLSLLPTYVEQDLDTNNLALIGCAAAAYFAFGALAQLLWRRNPARLAGEIGMVLTVVGLAGVVAAGPTESFVLLLLGSAVAGLGQGLALLGSLALLDAVMPAHHRADIMGTYWAVVYLFLGTGSLMLGVLATAFTVHDGVYVTSAALAVLCLAETALLAFRLRSHRHVRAILPLSHRLA